VKIISIGEVLWDLIGEAEHLGGAPFNFAAHARKLGHEVLFVSAVGHDERGQLVLERMRQLGLSTHYISRVPDHPTGTVSVTLDPRGEAEYVIHRPAAYDFPQLTNTQFDMLLSPPPDRIYFGTLQQTSSQAHELTANLLRTAPSARRFYDVNLRTNCYAPELVRELLSHADVVKLNLREVAELERMFGEPHRELEEFCRACANQFGCATICVTMGAEGCALLLGDTFVRTPGYRVPVADTVGTGDAFSAALLHALSCGWPATQAADFANRVGALIATRTGATPEWTTDELQNLTTDNTDDTDGI
jgi:fructokinase